MKAVFISFAALMLASCGAVQQGHEGERAGGSTLSDRVVIERGQPKIDIYEFKRSYPDAYYYSKNPRPVAEFARTGRTFAVLFSRPSGNVASGCRPVELLSCFETHSSSAFLRTGDCGYGYEFKESLGYICANPSQLAPARNHLALYVRQENYANAGWWRNVYTPSQTPLPQPWAYKYALGYLPR